MRHLGILVSPTYAASRAGCISAVANWDTAPGPQLIPVLVPNEQGAHQLDGIQCQEAGLGRLPSAVAQATVAAFAESELACVAELGEHANLPPGEFINFFPLSSPSILRLGPNIVHRPRRMGETTRPGVSGSGGRLWQSKSGMALATLLASAFYLRLAMHRAVPFGAPPSFLPMCPSSASLPED